MATRDSSGKETATHRTWRAMHNRCYNKNASNYGGYGGLGVDVCHRWFTYEYFLADMGERPPGMTLDRIDPAGCYKPENCRWANATAQAKNQRRTVHFTLNGVTKSIWAWTKETGISVNTLRMRRNRGWTDEEALTTPPKSIF